MLFNITAAGVLPLDILVGSLATLLATGGMYLTRKWKIFGYPVFAMLLPAIANGILVGWELAYYIGGGFWINCIYVAIGEAAVLLSLGSVLYFVITRHKLEKIIG